MSFVWWRTVCVAPVSYPTSASLLCVFGDGGEQGVEVFSVVGVSSGGAWVCSDGASIVATTSSTPWLTVLGLGVGLRRGKRGSHLGRRPRTTWRRRPPSKAIASSQYIKMINKTAAPTASTVASVAGLKEVPIDAGGIVDRGAPGHVPRPFRLWSSHARQ